MFEHAGVPARGGEVWSSVLLHSAVEIVAADIGVVVVVSCGGSFLLIARNLPMYLIAESQVLEFLNQVRVLVDLIVIISRFAF